MSEPYLDRLAVMLWWHMTVPGSQEQKVTRKCKAGTVITDVSGKAAQLVAEERCPLCN